MRCLRLRLRAEGERGQALPLAAVGIFIMTLGILATLNLGQAVHQKIKLQNTADSAAYTLAAMEARTFNYIAYLNRVQISHYNTAMMVQSYITWVGFQLSAYGMAVDLVSSMTAAAKVGSEISPPKIAALYKLLYGVLRIFETLYKNMRQGAQRLYDAGERIGHDLVEAMAIFNRDAIWQAQLARAALINVHLLTGMQNYIEKLDPEISFTKGKSALLNSAINMALNSVEYYQVFDRGAGMNPMVYAIPRDLSRVSPAWQGKYHRPQLELDPKQRQATEQAHRVMAELCHATRTPQFVSQRADWNIAFVPIPPYTATVAGFKMGQTKFTETGEMIKAKIPAIRGGKSYPYARYLSSDDYLEGGEALGAALVPAVATATGSFDPKIIGDAIAAYEDKGKHYRYQSSSENTTTMWTFPTAIATGPKFEVKDHSRWPGFAPYFGFNAKGDRSADYNQPSTWIFLNKNPKDFQTGDGKDSARAPWFTQLEWRNGAQVAKLDTTIGGARSSYLFEGLNVVSRGQAYYHRPGNWREHPNFFNPYWRARLAPVGQKLQGFWDRWVTPKVPSSADSAAVGAMLALLRNAQMDLFTSFISGLATH